MDILEKKIIMQTLIEMATDEELELIKELILESQEAY